MRTLLVTASVLVMLAAQAVSAGSCFRYTACSSCAAAKTCGWDAGMLKCKSGTVYGPNIGYASKWDWTVDKCKATTPVGSSCHTNTNCGSCISTTAGGCGWDARTMKCLAGNSTGPANAAPSATQEWSWSSCPPTPDCPQYASCASCTTSDSGDCGWNSLSSMCVLGTASGPHGSTMSNPSGWKFTNAQCNANTQNGTVNGGQCGLYTTCFNCTRSLGGNCGWNGKRCLTGTPAGPRDPTQSSSFWGWTSDVCQQSSLADGTSCSVALTLCSQITNCQECVNTPNSGLNCQWDMYREKCMGNDAYSPSMVLNGNPGSCKNDLVSCSSHTTCTGCTGDSSGICGWDAARVTCRQGTVYGPVVGRTRQWVWKQASCPKPTKCSDLLTCTACNSNTNNDLQSQLCCAWTPKGAGMGWGCTESSTSTCSGGSEWSTTTSCTVGTGLVDVSDCFSSVDCVSCAERAQCGWDYNAQTCRPGSALGPNDGDLPKQWDFTADQCGTEQCGGTCESNTQCGSCARSTNCGWDDARNVCREGDMSGPAHPHNTDDAEEEGLWQYGMAQCDYTSCMDYFSCYSCTDNPGCGWSGDDSGVCMQGDSTGSYAASSYVRWRMTSDQCGMSWRWMWNARSLSLWLTVGLLWSCCTLSVLLIRRRNRKLRVIRAAAAANAATPLTAAPAATTAVVAGQTPAPGTVYGAAQPGVGASYPYGTATYGAAAAAPSGHQAPDTDGPSCNAMPLMEDIQ